MPVLDGQQRRQHDPTAGGFSDSTQASQDAINVNGHIDDGAGNEYTDLHNIAKRDGGTSLLVAADTLRRRVHSDEQFSPCPREFALMSVAKLLEELGRSVRAGHKNDETVTEAAAEIAEHVLRHARS